MVCGLNCILFTLTFLDTVSGFISHHICLKRLSRPASMYSEFSVIFKARFVIRAAADQFLPYVLPWVLEHIHCLIFQNTGLVSATGRVSNSHKLMSAIRVSRTFVLQLALCLYSNYGTLIMCNSYSHSYITLYSDTDW